MTARFGNVKYATIVRDFDAHRRALNSLDLLAALETWDKCERWLEAVPNAPQPLISPKEAT